MERRGRCCENSGIFDIHLDHACRIRHFLALAGEYDPTTLARVSVSCEYLLIRWPSDQQPKRTQQQTTLEIQHLNHTGNLPGNPTRFHQNNITVNPKHEVTPIQATSGVAYTAPSRRFSVRLRSIRLCMFITSCGMGPVRKPDKHSRRQQ